MNQYDYKVFAKHGGQICEEPVMGTHPEEKPKYDKSEKHSTEKEARE